MKNILLLFAVIAFVGVSTTSFAQQTDAVKSSTATKVSLKKGKKSCCASKAGAKATCSKGAKATKVSLNTKAGAKKSCCASKAGAKATCSKGAKATKVSLNTKAGAKKSCCASKAAGAKATCSKDAKVTKVVETKRTKRVQKAEVMPTTAKKEKSVKAMMIEKRKNKK